MKTRSDGYYHQRNAIITLILTTVIAIFLYLSGHIWLAIGLVIGSICGLFIDPDLDHEWKTVAESRIDRLFGRVIGKVFRFYWSPYEILLEHRSPFSHGGKPPFGWLVMILVATPIRMIYSVLWAIPFIVRYRKLQLLLSQVPISLWVGVCGAWFLQDFIHWLRDFI